MIENIIEIDSKCIYLDKIIKGLFKKSVRMDWLQHKIYVDIKNKNVNFLISGERIFIKLIKVPKVKKKYLNKIVNSEMKYYFKDMNNLIYSYTTYKEHENYLDVAVFCINWTYMDVFNKLKENKNNIKGVWAVQLCFLVYFASKIKKDDFLFVFEYNEDLYMLICKNKVMIENEILHQYKALEEHKVIDYIDKNLQNHYIYFANMQDKSIIDKLNCKYNCEDLGILSRENLVKSFI